MDEKWKKRWRRICFRIPHTPEKTYTDSKEIEQALDLHRDKLYTFFSTLKPEDKDVRDKICLDLVTIAQRGNVLAEERLIHFLMPLVQEWMDTNKDFKVYLHDHESVQRLIKRCIYLTDVNKQKSFVAYVFTTMRMRARGFKNQAALSLDQPLNDKDNRTLYDKVSQKT